MCTCLIVAAEPAIAIDHDEGRELADKGRRGEIAALAAKVKAKIS